MVVLLLILMSVPSHATCYTKEDVQTNICWAVCRIDGFDTGSFEVKTKSCICGQRRKFSEVTDKTIKVVPKKKSDADDEDYYFLYR